MHVQEREYREAILGVDSEEVRLSPPKAKAQHRTQANTPAMRKPRRKAPQSKSTLLFLS